MPSSGHLGVQDAPLGGSEDIVGHGVRSLCNARARRTVEEGNVLFFNVRFPPHKQHQGLSEAGRHSKG